MPRGDATCVVCAGKGDSGGLADLVVWEALEAGGSDDLPDLSFDD